MSGFCICYDTEQDPSIIFRKGLLCLILYFYLSLIKVIPSHFEQKVKVGWE